MNSTSNSSENSENSRDRDTKRPRYGVRVPQSDTTGAPGPTPSATANEPRNVELNGEPSAQRNVSPKAARRMGRGLSFTVILLGALVGLGLMAIGFAEGWIVGSTLALLGVVGYVMVQFQIIPLFRDPDAVAIHRRSKLWLIPGSLLLIGLLGIGASFLVEPVMGSSIPEGLVDDYILAFIVAGMTMVVGSVLGFGLVAMAMLTRPDDDDSPLRPTNYAEQARQRDRDRDRGPNYYDSDWIRRGPRD